MYYAQHTHEPPFTMTAIHQLHFKYRPDDKAALREGTKANNHKVKIRWLCCCLSLKRSENLITFQVHKHKHEAIKSYMLLTVKIDKNNDAVLKGWKAHFYKIKKMKNI